MIGAAETAWRPKSKDPFWGLELRRNGTHRAYHVLAEAFVLSLVSISRHGAHRFINPALR